MCVQDVVTGMDEYRIAWANQLEEVNGDQDKDDYQQRSPPAVNDTEEEEATPVLDVAWLSSLSASAATVATQSSCQQQDTTSNKFTRFGSLR